MELLRERPKLKLEDYFRLEKELYEKGFLQNDYIVQPETKHTTVKCPICENNVVTYSHGNSYEITCNTENCIKTGIRGI